jgi:hypothetical protein
LSGTISDPSYTRGNAYGVDEMRVTLTDPPDALVVDGVLKTTIKSEGDGAFPHMVLTMTVSGRSDPVEVSLSELDLFTIVDVARKSKVEKLRDAVR